MSSPAVLDLDAPCRAGATAGAELGAEPADGTSCFVQGLLEE